MFANPRGSLEFDSFVRGVAYGEPCGGAGGEPCGGTGGRTGGGTGGGVGSHAASEAASLAGQPAAVAHRGFRGGLAAGDLTAGLEEV